MSVKAHPAPVVDSTAVFKDGIFNGKVLFCTGGGSGICKEMTRAVVSGFNCVAGAEKGDVQLFFVSPRCAMARTQSFSDESTVHLMRQHVRKANSSNRLDRLTASAEELSKDTGKTCIAIQADVRQPKALQDAAAKTIEKFGRIDFVICGTYPLARPPRQRLISHEPCQQVPLEISWLLSQACPRTDSGP